MKTVLRVILVIATFLATSYVYANDLIWLQVGLAIFVIAPTVVAFVGDFFSDLSFFAKAVGVTTLVSAAMFFVDPVSLLVGFLVGYVVRDRQEDRETKARLRTHPPQ